VGGRRSGGRLPARRGGRRGGSGGELGGQPLGALLGAGDALGGAGLSGLKAGVGQQRLDPGGDLAERGGQPGELPSQLARPGVVQPGRGRGGGRRGRRAGQAGAAVGGAVRVTAVAPRPAATGRPGDRATGLVQPSRAQRTTAVVGPVPAVSGSVGRSGGFDRSPVRPLAPCWARVRGMVRSF